ncbi:MAG: DUF1553 domain-containing protein [Acidobacteriota bacterium]
MKTGILLGILYLASAPFASSASVDFQRQIQPILSDNCLRCHGPDESSRMAGLRLDLKDGLFSQRPHGAPVIPGNAPESLLYKRISDLDPRRRMPPLSAHKELTDAQKALLRQWIEEGAEWKQHWAFTPPARPGPPPVKNDKWPRNSIDRFVLAKLEANGLQPAAEANKRELIRRVTLDLTGLPPSPQDVESFVNDKSEDAYPKLVDRLLASEHFGEHRAHYWLDAARYADTNGFHYDNYREMWPYRDWVIQAFNRNLPYDKFIVEQLAGDLLPNPTLDQLIASGFNRNHSTTSENGVIEEEMAVMYVKDRADTTAAVFLGLTAACATCHDHKFDPISQKDHYALEAFFNNTTQRVMDYNRPDQPPMVIVPQTQDRERWSELHRRQADLNARLTAIRQAPSAAFESWLSTDAALPSMPLEAAPEVFRLAVDSARFEPGVTLDADPWQGRRALKFDGKSALKLPNVNIITGREAFSVSTWLYVPKIKYHPGLTGDGSHSTIASQLERTSTAGPNGTPVVTRRGWIMYLDQGVPGMELFGDEGKAIRAQALQNAPLKEGAWTHLTFTYDGSGKETGLSLHVNGSPVPTERGAYGIQYLHVAKTLPGTAKTDAPLLMGSDGDQGFFEGSIAEFGILGRAISDEEARLLTAWPQIIDARKVNVSQQTAAQKESLRLYFSDHSDGAYRDVVHELASVDAELKTIENRSDTALIMEDRTDTKPTANLLFRGLYDQPREALSANVPSVLPPMPDSLPRNRLGLAEWMVEPSNPLVARVAVNRFWQQIFGVGIVKTTEDFGSQGEPPSHPELLDWLAVDFRESGWDVKNLLRQIVTSASYRQSSAQAQNQTKDQNDPDNRLLAHGPRFRMDAEMVRDLALSASGLLVSRVGGPPAKPYQPSGVWEATSMKESNTRNYVQDTGENLYRRSLYTLWKRSAPPASLETFDAPTRETYIVRRERTDTPLQALVTMNDPQFVEAARNLAEHAMHSDPSLDAQVDYMTSRLLARQFRPKERQVVARSYDEFFSYFESHKSDASRLLATGESKADATLPVDKFAALTVLANELLNLDEVLNK